MFRPDAQLDPFSGVDARLCEPQRRNGPGNVEGGGTEGPICFLLVEQKTLTNAPTTLPRFMPMPMQIPNLPVGSQTPSNI